MDTLTAHSYHQVTGAAVKLHDFETKYPESWFIGQRQGSGTAASHRRELSSTKLSVATIERLGAFYELCNPISRANPYEEIKSALLDSYKKTTSEDLQDLFDSMSLGDKRPSELLSEMRSCRQGRLRPVPRDIVVGQASRRPQLGGCRILNTPVR